MSVDARTLAWAAVARYPVPLRALVALLRAFGGPESLEAANRARIERVVGPALATRIIAARSETGGEAGFEATVNWLGDPGHHLVAWDDPDYPQALLELPDAPVALFHLGRRELLNRPALAIVGSRNATAQGKAIARDFAAALGDAGLTIVSGLATGIDSAAHEGALGSAGATIAVVATGPDRVYPAKHRALMAAIAERGAVVAESPPGTGARKERFPRRNRLISGLSRGVLVVEATLSSGSLITARLAGEQGRDVFAVPGSIHSPFSKGCHKLIREGAKLVESAQDILGELGWNNAIAESPGGAPAENGIAAAAGHGGGPAGIVLDAIGHGVATVDMIVERTGLAAATVTAELVRLELAQRIAALPGGAWQRV